MTRFYSNENFPLPVVLELRRLGHDVITIQETGRANLRLDDLSVLRFARDDNRAVLTFNRRHFVRLHSEMPAHAGIVVCTTTRIALRLRIEFITRFPGSRQFMVN